MALEVATYISDLVVSNPPSTDKRRQGDDHLRLIKSAVKNTFPNITGAVTATHEELNNAAAGFTSALFLNEVRMYYGDPSALPAGWHVCDGTNGTPDLRNLVPIGAGSTYTLGQSVGSANPTTSSTSGGTPAGTVGGTALTEAQLPVHDHFTVADVESTNEVNTSTSVAKFNDTSLGDLQYKLMGSAITPTLGLSSPVGSGDTHTHTFTGNALSGHTHTVSALQPALALHFVMYTGV